MLDRLFGLIAPHECLCCHKEGSLLCRPCWADIPAAPACCYKCRRGNCPRFVCDRCSMPFDGLLAAAAYGGMAKPLIAKLKFGRAAAGADVIADIMAERLALPSGVVVTYVPTADRRVRIRGYDQARLIATALSKRTNLPCDTLLYRMGNERQVGKDAITRRKQMNRSFRLKTPNAARDKDILLVDDILTTGSTLEAAATVLRRGGAANIRVAVFAIA